MWLIFLLAAFSFGFAQGGSPAGAGAGNASDTSSANLATFADINIFSQMPLGSIYILWTNVDISADIVKQITSRSFVLEPYFMQNIDREQFEQKRILHLFEAQKKEFFKLFPDEEEEE